MKTKISEILNNKQNELGFTEMLKGSQCRYVIGLTHNNNPSIQKLIHQYNNLESKFDNICIGGRKDSETGIYYIDIGTTTNNLLRAKRLQLEYKQIAIFDLKTLREI